MTDEEKKELTGCLLNEQCSCVIRQGQETRIFRERGVKDLFRLLKEEPGFLQGALIVDKVVGKAAASLMILGGIKEVFAEVISRPALDLFQTAGVKAGYRLEVPHIINRTHTDWCPLEIRCFGLRTAEECLEQIEDFLNRQQADRLA